MNRAINDVMTKLRAADHPRIWLTGVAAGSAYLAEMPLDNALLDYEHSDIRLQGEMFFRNPYWVPLGLGQHYTFSIFMAYIYALYGRDRLPGPEWLRGLILINLELVALTPLVPLIDRVHPAVRAGELKPLGNLKGQLNQIMRHAAFGLVLGTLWSRLRKS